MRYNKLDKRFEEILTRHNVCKKSNLDIATERISKMVESIPPDSTVGLYGVGACADALLCYLDNNDIRISIDYCFDKTQEQYSFRDCIRNEEVSKIDRLYEFGVDYMIIGSYLHSAELVKILQGMNYSGEILNFFEILQEYLEEHTTNYKEIYDTRILYENSENDEQRKNYLMLLIKRYLLIKDFQSAFSYIEKYIELGFDADGNYAELQGELTGLLDDIKKKIARRTTKDVIVYWMDAVPYAHMDMFPNISKAAQDGISFENAYTVNPWTTETLKCIMYGQKSIEDRLFLKKDFQMGDTLLLDYLNRGGYTFAYIGLDRFVKLFPKKSGCTYTLNFRENASSIPQYWNMLEPLYEHEGAVCVFVHTFCETHPPYLCGELEKYKEFGVSETEWKDQENVMQAQMSAQYIDSRRAFYDDMIGKSAVRVIMSDHGRVTQSIVRELRTHIILIIQDEGHKAEKVDGMFSLMDFSKILEMCISGEYDFEKVSREYVVVEALDFYNAGMVEKILCNDGPYRSEAYQRRAVITPTDRYLLFAKGEERYFVGKDDVNDCIDIPEYQERIAKLRAICGDEFIDISKYRKFKASMKLYSNGKRIYD